MIAKTISKHFQTFVYLFLFQQISDDGKKRLKEITRLCMKKSLTEAGRERKKRIAHELFHKRITTNLQLYFYISTLPLFKSFVLVFEQKEPMVHRLHDELKETLRSFLAFFLKIEKVKSISTKKYSKWMLKQKTTKNQWRNGLWGKQAKSHLLYGLNK